MMISIQQPEHAPWMGFFFKMSLCETTVMFDTVQFKKRYFENRNKILAASGEQWLTVPVLTKGKFNQNICEVEICDDRDWRRKYLGQIEYAYARTPYFTELFPQLEEIISHDHKHLVELNLDIIHWAAGLLGIQTHIIRASEIGSFASSSSRLLLDICITLGATDYLCGKSGPDYMDMELFRKEGISVKVVNYTPREYPQSENRFKGYLSVYDVLFRHAADARNFLPPPEG